MFTDVNVQNYFGIKLTTALSTAEDNKQANWEFVDIKVLNNLE